MLKKNLNKYQGVPPVPNSIWKNPLHFIAFGFGFGALPVAPGTFGTLIAIPFYLALQYLPLSYYFIATLLIIILSIWICDKVTKEINIHDHQGMCLDEIVGYIVTMINAPHGLPWIILGFLLFRFFDIFKPWPIMFLDQKVTGGFGIIIDDVFAGIYAMIIIQICAKLLL